MQRVVLNGQCSSWEFIQFGLPQGSVSGQLLSLIYINDLPENVKFTCKVFADDASSFFPVTDKKLSRNELNTHLQSISDLTYQWKIRFNPNPNKQTQVLYFSRKTNKGDF